MLKDGASGGAGRLPPNDSHDEFLELCATATTGLLTREERRRLDGHLSHCESCREIMSQYQALADRVLPNLAPMMSQDDSARSEWSQDLAEAKLFARLNDGDRTFIEERAPKEKTQDSQTSSSVRRPAPSEEALWSHMWVQFAAAVMLVAALGLMAYRIGKRRGADTAARASVLPISKPETGAAAVSEAAGHNQGSSAKEAADLRVETLQSQLREKLSEIARLQSQQAEAEKQITLSQAEKTELIQDRATLAEQVRIAQQNLAALELKLDSVTSQSSQESVRNLALQQRVGELTQNMTERDQEIARERALLDHDRDIRELMGSRDLYIAEVYDVAKTGDTQKPFGRVFYTRGKRLIFYAYDLDQQKGIERVSTFQAWGRIGPDRDRAVNLGILYQDNANKKRWVLKADNPKTLAQIDAVFVTVEPNGGSEHPSGKPLLFAYLKIQPNHP